VEDYFLTSSDFRYTLNVSRSGDEEPISAFLFKHRFGHCEYFAAAMTLMVRSLGIPARVVNGFKGGEYNPFDGAYKIRERDAHSWVEVYIQQSGWVPFDPTPHAAGTAGGPARMFGTLSKFYDFLETKWIISVVGYDGVHQAALTNAFRTMMYRLIWPFIRYRPRGFNPLAIGMSAPEGKHLIVGLLFGGVAAATVFLALTYRAQLAKFVRWRPRPRQRCSVPFYRQTLKALARRGFVREDHLTADEFAGTVAAEDESLAGSVSELTEAFCRVRYGDEKLTLREKQRVQTLLKELSHERA